MKTTKEILVEARGYIAQGWTQGAYARDAHDLPRDGAHPDAVCWCMYGALHRAEGPELYRPDVRDLLSEIVREPLDEWNDDEDRKHAEVLAAFDRAIEMAGAE